MSYFSRVILEPGNYNATKLLKNILSNAYYEHQNLWKLFPHEPDANRDFIYRCEQKGLARVYYIVSRRKPEQTDAWQVESKPYEPKILEEELLSFSLRVNPIIKRKDKEGKAQRHDVVMNTKKRLGYSDLPPSERPAMADLIRESGAKWLHGRAEECGFVFEDGAIITERYEQYQTYKQGNKGTIRYSTLDFSGILRVTEADKFTRTLLNGIGPAKAFGCGLLLVRRS